MLEEVQQHQPPCGLIHAAERPGKLPCTNPKAVAARQFALPKLDRFGSSVLEDLCFLAPFCKPLLPHLTVPSTSTAHWFFSLYCLEKASAA